MPTLFFDLTLDLASSQELAQVLQEAIALSPIPLVTISEFENQSLRWTYFRALQGFGWVAS